MELTTRARECCDCGATESFESCRDRRTGEIVRVETWYAMRMKRTNEIAAYRCADCHDALPANPLAW
jgi:hypothetical protein